MDRAFLRKTMLAVALRSVLNELTPRFIRFDGLPPLSATLIGGVLLAPWITPPGL